MANEEVVGGIGGAAQGAATGFLVAGPVGAFVGGILGGIGGIFGGKKKKAQKRAARLQREAALVEVFLQRRAQLREGQVLEAQALAAGIASGADIESSAQQGIRASIRTQQEANLKASDAVIGRRSDAQAQELKAETYSFYSSVAFGLLDAAVSFGSLKPPSSRGSTSEQTGNVNQSPFAGQGRAT